MCLRHLKIHCNVSRARNVKKTPPPPQKKPQQQQQKNNETCKHTRLSPTQVPGLVKKKKKKSPSTVTVYLLTIILPEKQIYVCNFSLNNEILAYILYSPYYFYTE